MNWLGTNTTAISGRASMDFPLQRWRCSDYPNVMTSISIVETKRFCNVFFYVKCCNLFITRNYSYNLLPNTAFSKFDKRFKMSVFVLLYTGCATGVCTTGCCGTCVAASFCSSNSRFKRAFCCFNCSNSL